METGSDKVKERGKEQEKDEAVTISRKGTKIGHRRIDEDGQITYKKVHKFIFSKASFLWQTCAFNLVLLLNVRYKIYYFCYYSNPHLLWCLQFSLVSNIQYVNYAQ